MTASRPLVAPTDSPLSLSLVELDAGGSSRLGADPALHELVYVLEGDIVLQTPSGGGAAAGGAAGGGAAGGDAATGQVADGGAAGGGAAAGEVAVAAENAFLHDGADGELVVGAGARGARLAVFSAGPGCDVHAPLGERVPSVALDLADAGSATGRRSFQVLLGPENGCCRATMFLGVVPPGAAPWHFHQYDEIVLIVRGGGTYHDAAGDHPTAPLSAVRISPRSVHINENTGDDDMHVLGVFTPAGSPAAAYLAADPRPR